MSSEGFFMCIVSAVNSPCKSFEEVRVEDYVRSYQSSGRAPLPIPPEPTDEIQRKALGLPPLFKPESQVTLSSSSSASTTTAKTTTILPILGPSLASTSSSSTTTTTAIAKQRISNSADIPLGQEFKLPSVAMEKYHQIVCMPEYEGFSPEELRYYAYIRGNIKPPFPIAMDPFISYINSTPRNTSLSEEKLQSQCALPEYNRHSPEELRVAWMINKREMSSNDLLGPAIPSISTAPPIPVSFTGSSSISSPNTSVTLPSAPKFNFVFNK